MRDGVGRAVNKVLDAWTTAFGGGGVVEGDDDRVSPGVKELEPHGDLVQLLPAGQGPALEAAVAIASSRALRVALALHLYLDSVGEGGGGNTRLGAGGLHAVGRHEPVRKIEPILDCAGFVSSHVDVPLPGLTLVVVDVDMDALARLPVRPGKGHGSARRIVI